MFLLHLAAESGQPDRVEEWGRRLTSQQVTEFMAYYEARQNILDGGREPISVTPRAPAPTRRHFVPMDEAELRAAFRAHNARLSA